MSRILIRNGTVVTARDTFGADVLVEGETIREVRSGIDARAAEQVLEAHGMYVIPGGVDVHTHLDMPLGEITSSDDFETGTRAAAFGGTTTIVDYATQSRGSRMRGALECWFRKAEGRAFIDYGLHMIVTDLADGGLDEMDALVREGVTSFKLFMAYPRTLMADDATIFRVLSQTAKNGGLVCMHAENGGVIDVLIERALGAGKTAPIWHALTRPVRAEAEAVHRAIALAEISGVPIYIVHVSSDDALAEVRDGRRRGVPVFGETCPQYLLLSVNELERPGSEGSKYVLTPPLRERSHQEALWDALRRGDLATVATDHCPFRFADQKALGKDDFTKIPNGGPGIEHRLQLLYHYGVSTGKLSLNRFVDLTSTMPSRLFGMYPKKGEIAAGSDADLVIWDPAAVHKISVRTHHMRVDYSLFEGWELRGNARIVLSRGRVIVDQGRFLGQPGYGRYLRRAAPGSSFRSAVG